MRHRVAGRKLSRNTKQRKALFKNLINALVTHGAIRTTEAKAKAIKGLVDKLITKGKGGTVHARRLIAAFLQNKEAVNKIVDELGPVFKDRSSGFTRIIRLGKRRGDDAMMVRLELVEQPEVKGDADKKRYRPNKSTGKKGAVKTKPKSV